MNPAYIVARAIALDGSITLQGGKLAVRLPESKRAQMLVSEIKENRDSIICYLQKRHHCSEAGLYPLSDAQRLVWAAFAADSENLDYNNIGAFRIEETTLERLRMVISELAKTEVGICLKIEVILGEPFQNFNGPLPDIMVCKAKLWTHDTVREKLKVEAEAAFDIRTGPCCKIILFIDQQGNHIVGVVTHHIAFDMSSYYSLAAKITAKLSQEGLHYMPTGQLTYRDFAIGQSVMTLDQNAIDYWREHLLEPWGALNLYPGRTRTNVRRHSTIHSTFELSDEVTKKIIFLSKKIRTTPFKILLSALQVVIARISGQSEFLIGIASSQRDELSVGTTIGDFTNPMPFRNVVGPCDNLLQILRKVEKQLSDISDNNLSLIKLIEQLKLGQGVDAPPLLQIMFSWGHGNKMAMDRAGSIFQQFIMPEQMGAFTDLVIIGSDNGDRIIINLRARASYVARDTLNDLSSRWQELVQRLVEDIQTPCLELAVTETDRQNYTLCGSALVQMPASPILLIERRIKERPDDIALLREGRKTTYRQFGQKIAQHQQYLKQVGVGPGDRVAVGLRRDENLLSFIIAILNLGAAYVPIDSSMPENRINAILQAVKANLILLDDEFGFWSGKDRVLFWNSLPPLADGEALDFRADAHCADQSAYFLFTSGSTGEPKGVEVSHGNIVGLIEWAKTTYTSEDMQKVLFATPMLFDISVFEIFCTLAMGGCVVIADNLLHMSDSEEWDGITLINTTPTLLLQLLRTAQAPLDLQVVNLAGEALAIDSLRKLRRDCGSARILNLYGPTEDTCYSVWADVSQAQGKPPIGLPISGSNAHILDFGQQPVCAYGIGELYLTGQGVAKGYVGKPEMTERVFALLPTDTTFGRAYRTGDLVRKLSNGDLEFIGRIDRQVKLHGVRIELEEVETILTRHPGVQECWVQYYNGLNPVLIAFVSLADQTAVTKEELRNYAAEYLPAAMIPSDIVPLDDPPMTLSGKIDRKALQWPVAPVKTKSLPENDAERRVAKIWATVLNVEQPSVDDSFLGSGGHSLKAMQLIAMINEEFALSLPVSAVMKMQTIRRIAKLVTVEGNKGSHGER